MRIKADEYYKNLRKKAYDKWFVKMKSYTDQSFLHYIAGLYDGEGRHSSTDFSLSNSDNLIIQLFIKFCEEVLQTSYTVRLYIHGTHNRHHCKKYWKDKNVRIDAITQTDNRKQKKNNKTKENYGTINVRVKKSLSLREALENFSYKTT